MSESEEKLETQLDKTVGAINKIKEFDPNDLAQTSRLGAEMAFDEAIEPAKRIVALYGQIRVDALEDFPEKLLVQIKNQADQHFTLFGNILNFSSSQDNPSQARTQLLGELQNGYDNIFSQLQPIIAYTAQRTTDFGRLEQEGKQAAEAIEAKTSKLVGKIEKSEQDVQIMLENVRQAAGELGVSQQAVAFDESVTFHTEQSETWHKRILWTGGVLGAYAISTMFFHLVPFFTKADPIQLTVSKVLLFGVISSYLYICIRNYTSHKHNAIVDKHRQNALRTFKALMDAAEGTPHSEVILVHAAACIFGPQNTGYAKDNPTSTSPIQQAVELFSPTVRRD